MKIVLQCHAFVEGTTDRPFAERLLSYSGFSEISISSGGGKSEIDRELSKYAQMGFNSPVVALRDLDQDAACAPTWIEEHALGKVGQWFRLRIAVRSIEAWFLADRTHAAKQLAVDLSRIPLAPDGEDDPKSSVLKIASTSKNDRIKRLLLPKAGSTARVGPGYQNWLIESAAKWDPATAEANSPSLARSVRSIKELRSSYRRSLSGRGSR